MSEFECADCGGLMSCKGKPYHTCDDCGGRRIGRMDGKSAKELAAEDEYFTISEEQYYDIEREKEDEEECEIDEAEDLYEGVRTRR